MSFVTAALGMGVSTHMYTWAVWPTPIGEGAADTYAKDGMVQAGV